MRIVCLAGLLALLLGGCISARDDQPGDAPIDQPSRIETRVNRAVPSRASDPARWTLRRTML